MPNYQIYCLDAQGNILRPGEMIECVDDNTVRTCGRCHPGIHFEVENMDRATTGWPRQPR